MEGPNPNRIEIYIVTKDGILLHKYDLIHMDQLSHDQLMSGFLSALNSFASDLGFPQGVGLIRSGTMECRFSPGKYIFSALIIDYSMPLGLNSEGILSGLANDVTELFEKQFSQQLIEGDISRVYRSSDFSSFNTVLNNLIDRYGRETFELYQKLILIEAMYAKVPQKWIIPLVEQAQEGGSVLEELRMIPVAYRPQLLKVIRKINYEGAPVWKLFAIYQFTKEDFD